MFSFWHQVTLITFFSQQCFTRKGEAFQFSLAASLVVRAFLKEVGDVPLNIQAEEGLELRCSTFWTIPLTTKLWHHLFHQHFKIKQGTLLFFFFFFQRPVGRVYSEQRNLGSWSWWRNLSLGGTEVKKTHPHIPMLTVVYWIALGLLWLVFLGCLCFWGAPVWYKESKCLTSKGA